MKFFSAVEMMALLADRELLDEATKVLAIVIMEEYPIFENYDGIKAFKHIFTKTSHDI